MEHLSSELSLSSKLQDSYDMLRAIGRMASVGGWEINLQNQTLHWTDEVYRIHEVEDDYTPSLNNALQFYAPDSRPVIEAAVEGAIAEQEPFDCVLQIVTAKGQLRWVRALGQASVINDKVAKVFGTFQDVTEQKETEKALLDTELIQRVILNGVTANILFVNERQEIIWANQNASTTAKLSPHELLGKKCHALWADPAGPCVNCPTQRALISGKMEESQRIAANGIIWRERNEPVYDVNGALLGIVQIAQDITQQVRLEARVRQAEKMEVVGHLAGGIAHDFNNILFGILGYAEMSLTLANDNEELTSNLEHIQKGAERAKQLVRKILDFSRQGTQEKRPVELLGVVKETMGLLRATIPSTVLFRTELSDAAGFIEADPISIHEILMNLFTNACDAMGEKGTLTVLLKNTYCHTELDGRLGCIAPGRYLTLEVRDTGPGIAEGTLLRMFEPFYTTKPVGKGTGMGLAVVFGLMQQHDGNIQVESTLGAGTCFRLFFPAIETHAQAVAAAGMHGQGKGECILVVDDEPEIVAVMTRILVQGGYRVLQAVDGVAAMEVLRTKGSEIALMITDQTMPYMSGIELAREASVLYPDLPILMCTGYSNQVSELNYHEFGVAKLCAKPVAIQELEDAIKECLERSRRNGKNPCG